MLLGLKKDILVSDSKLFHTRFGVELPVPGHDNSRDSTVTFAPHPSMRCTISARRGVLHLPSVFQAELFAHAIQGLPREYRKAVFRTKLFSVQLRCDGFDLDLHPGQALVTLKTWGDFWNLMLMFAEGEGAITFSGEQPASFTYTEDIPQSEFPYDPAYCNYWIDLCRQAYQVFVLAGLGFDPEVSLTALSENANAIMSFNQIISSCNVPVLSFSTGHSSLSSIPAKVDVIYATYLKLGGVTISYYAVANMLPKPIADRINWSSENIALKRIAVLGNCTDQFDQFVGEAQRKTGIVSVVVGSKLHETATSLDLPKDCST